MNVKSMDGHGETTPDNERRGVEQNAVKNVKGVGYQRKESQMKYVFHRH